MKVSVIGAAGAVGSAAAFHIGAQRLAEEILLIDIKPNVVQQHAMDMSTAFSDLGIVVRAGTYSDMTGSDLVINAAGANTLYELYTKQGLRWNAGRYNRDCVQAYLKHLDDTNYKPCTVASAIEISRPVSLPKALRALEAMNNGVVRQVTDEMILEHRAMVAKTGFGCEPASAASVAGLHLLLQEQVVSPGETVVCILTGHELKDPDATVKYHTGLDMKAATIPPARPVHGKYANRPIRVPDDVRAICKALGVDIDKTPLAGLPCR